MGLFSKDIKTLNDLFVQTLKDIYDAGNQIGKALPDMIEKATDAGLKQGFKAHMQETKGHVQRLDNVFEQLSVRLGVRFCASLVRAAMDSARSAGEIRLGSCARSRRSLHASNTR